MLSLALLAAATPLASQDRGRSLDPLIGAWTVKVQFHTGAFKDVKDLEFMLVFNLGGTMTESSNYDGAPPVPPAYGIWRKTGARRYEAKYAFYNPKPPARFEEISGGGGWLPAGKGILRETITLSANGRSYASTLSMDLFDALGKKTETWSARCRGIRMAF